MGLQSVFCLMKIIALLHQQLISAFVLDFLNVLKPWASFECLKCTIVLFFVFQRRCLISWLSAKDKFLNEKKKNEMENEKLKPCDHIQFNSMHNTCKKQPSFNLFKSQALFSALLYLVFPPPRFPLMSNYVGHQNHSPKLIIVSRHIWSCVNNHQMWLSNFDFQFSCEIEKRSDNAEWGRRKESPTSSWSHGRKKFLFLKRRSRRSFQNSDLHIPKSLKCKKTKWTFS